MAILKEYILSDTAKGTVSESRLDAEIRLSSVKVAIDFLITYDDNGTTKIKVQFKSELDASDITALDWTVSIHDGTPLPVMNNYSIDSSPAFASKTLVDGRSLYKRVHGINNTILAGTTGKIFYELAYNQCKFSGAEIINCAIKDKVDFHILDTDTNYYSGLDVATYGANVMLNKFGYGVEMTKDVYSNTSNYDANLYSGMFLECVYTNNDTINDKYIAVNFELHEVI